MRIAKHAGMVLLATCSQMAFAQSSVTLYGLIDEGINYVNNAQTGRAANGHISGGSQWSVADGASGIGGSRWGLMGNEDLGGGLKALFVLENGFNIQNGTLAQGGLEFGRQAYVGLAGTFGTLTVGRQYDIVPSYVGPLSVTGSVPGHEGGHPDDIDGYGHSVRVNNSFKFETPAYRGLKLGGMYSVGGVAGDVTQRQMWALAASYNQGPVMLAVGYTNARDPNLSYFGTNGNSGGATTNNMGSSGSPTAAQSNPVYAGFASAERFELLDAGVKYRVGPVSIGGTYSHVSFGGLGDLAAGPNPLHYTGSAVFNIGEINASYSITSALEVSGAFSYTHKASVGSYGTANYRQTLLALAYFLSKRTELYAIGIYQQASGTDSLGQPAVASILSVTPSATNKQVLARVGILHKF